MAGSLKDQLLKVGLADKKRARRAEHEKRQESTSKAKGKPVEDVAARAKALREEQSQRSKALNQQREEEARRRALAAEISQLIDTHKLDRRGGEAAYQFADQRKVQKIYVTAAMVEPLARGQMAVVRQGRGYEVVPVEIGKRLRERDEAVVVVLHDAAGNNPNNAPAEEDDPYAAYQVPDDLMW